jgi:transcriptional regulator with XRE-family HTH domain
MEKTFDIEAMRQRISAVLTEKNISKRQASLAAGLGPGYVHSIIAEGKEPTVTNLAQVCNAIGVSLAYVMYGAEISPQVEKLISLIDQNPQKRDAILALLES